MTALTYGMEAWANVIERNRENTRKDTKKDISTSSSNNFCWYHNKNRNVTGRAKDPIGCNER